MTSVDWTIQRGCDVPVPKIEYNESDLASYYPESGVFPSQGGLAHEPLFGSPLPSLRTARSACQ